MTKHTCGNCENKMVLVSKNTWECKNQNCINQGKRWNLIGRILFFVFFPITFSLKIINWCSYASWCVFGRRCRKCGKRLFIFQKSFGGDKRFHLDCGMDYYYQDKEGFDRLFEDGYYVRLKE